METVINGSNLVVQFGTSGSEKVVLCSTSCAVNISADTKEVVCKGGGGWKNLTAGSKGWDMSVDGLYVESAAGGGNIFSDIFDAIAAGTEVSVIFGEENPTTGQITYKGSAYITSTSLTAPADDNSTFSATFTGTGALTKAVAV